MDKKGDSGNFISLFIVTIVIVFLLALYVLGSAIIKEFSEEKEGVVMYEEAELEIGDSIVYYIENNYKNLTKIRMLRKTTDKSAEEILKEVSYET